MANVCVCVVHSRSEPLTPAPVDDSESSTEETADQLQLPKHRSILKAFSGGAESDVTSDSSMTDRKVSFGRQQTMTPPH